MELKKAYFYEITFLVSVKYQTHWLTEQTLISPTLQAHTFSFLSRFLLLLYPNCSFLICRLLKLQLLLQTPQQTTRMQVAEEPENITKYGAVFLGICFLHGVCLSAVRAHSVNVKQLSWRDYLQK